MDAVSTNGAAQRCRCGRPCGHVDRESPVKGRGCAGKDSVGASGEGRLGRQEVRPRQRPRAGILQVALAAAAREKACYLLLATGEESPILVLGNKTLPTAAVGEASLVTKERRQVAAGTSRVAAAGGSE